MNEESMALIELVEKQAPGNLVREVLAFATERIIEAEAEARTGLARGARTPMREVQRKGYCDRNGARFAKAGAGWSPQTVSGHDAMSFAVSLRYKRWDGLSRRYQCHGRKSALHL